MVEIGTVLSFIQAAGIIVGVAYYIINIQNNMKNQKLTLETRKADVTNNILRNLLSLDSWRAFIDVMNLEWKDYEDFTKKYDSLVSPDLAAKRLFYLSTLENVGYLLKTKIIDTESVYQTGGLQAVWFYTRMKPVIDGYRKNSWGRERFKNVDYLASEMYKLIIERDPSFKGDQFYFDTDDMDNAFGSNAKPQ